MSFEISLQQALAKLPAFGLGQTTHLLEKIARPAYQISTIFGRNRSQNADLIWSKIGGKPDLPKDFNWPKNTEQSMVFFSQINLADLETIPRHIDNLNLPKQGLISIFLPAVASSDLQSIEFSDYTKVLPKIYHFPKLEDLVATTSPADLRIEKISENVEPKPVSNTKILNSNFKKNQNILTPPILKPDKNGSFDSYFKALELYATSLKTVENNNDLRSVPKYSDSVILEKTTFQSLEPLVLEVTDEEIFLDFSVFACFPYWAESDIFTHNGFPVECKNQLNQWLEWWHDQNKYSGSNILGYAQSVQNIDQKHITDLILQNYSLTPDLAQKLWHFLSFGWDFEDIFSLGPLSASNNFYLYQSIETCLDFKYSWLDIQSD